MGIFPVGGRREIFKTPRCFLAIARTRGSILENAVQTSVHEFSFKAESPVLSKMVRIHDITRGDPTREFVVRVFQYKHEESRVIGETIFCLDSLLTSALSESPQVKMVLNGRPVGSLTICNARVLSDISGGVALNMQMEETQILCDEKIRGLTRFEGKILSFCIVAHALLFRQTEVHFSGVAGSNLPKGKCKAFGPFLFCMLLNLFF